MKRMPIIISHYTKDTGYETEVKNLIESLDKYKLKYDIEAIPSFKTKDGVKAWRRNSNYCSLLVQKMLNKYPDHNVLRVDADAVFKSIPFLFTDKNFDADIAAHIHDFRWHTNELLGGTIFFKNNDRVKSLVNQWALDCMINKPNERNPDLLQNIINSKKFDIKFESLPASYCTIFDSMSDTKDPVILHNQASRRFKSQVNYEGDRNE